MTIMKLINKDALVEEIERLIDEIYAGRPFDSLSREQQVALWYVRSIMSSINTLEVKEVDLEKEIKEQSDKYYSQCEKKLQEMDDNDNDLSFLSLDNYAKYFFELGMQVSNKAQKEE